MSDLITVMAGAAGAGGAETDEYFNQTTLLLHGDGTNGAQNNTFLDSSTNNFTITRNGNTTQGTFSPFSNANGEWSNYFDGTGDYLTVADNAAFQVGSGAFTLECWVYLTTTGTDIRIYSYQPASGTASEMNLYRLATNVFALALRDSGGTGYTEYTTTSTVLANTWYHVAAARDASGNIAIWVNGARENSTASSTQSIASGLPGIGGRADGTQIITGYLSNLRLVKGTDVYGASNTSITVPTTPLTAIANTSLLTCQSNRFVDNSTNAFAITANGNVKVTPFSPFAPTAAYDASVNGGSAYLDGSGDNLSLTNSTVGAFGTGDYTVEFWLYKPTDTNGAIVDLRGGDLSHGVSVEVDTTLKVFYGGSPFVTGGSFNKYAWNHFCICRDSGTLRGFINGVQVFSLADTNNRNADPEENYIGRNYLNAQLYTGYIADVRVTHTAVYTSAFTPPTAPLTAITGTELLLNFTNAGIFDNTGKNNLETVADAQIDTTTKKYGTGSMEFDGTGDWLLMLNNENQQLGTGDFTIEFWVYLATGDAGSNRGLVAKGTSTTGFLVSLNTTEKVVFTYTTSTITSTGAITLDAWNHIAVVREGTGSNETKIYIGGTNDGTGTVSTDFTQTSVMYVGANRTGGDPMKGFIDDLRITKGVARYTTTFTPPTKAFPDL